MVDEVRVYFEGSEKLKPGFHEVFSEVRGVAREARCGFKLIATGGTPVRDFKIALTQHPRAWNVLLLDSEGPDTGRLSSECCRREGFAEQTAASIFWMVQLMEAWLLADPDALRGYYGDGFHADRLRHNPRIEDVPKERVIEMLKAATRHTSKGAYHKTRHAPALLARIEPGRVMASAPNCRRLFDALRSRISGRAPVGRSEG